MESFGVLSFLHQFVHGGVLHIATGGHDRAKDTANKKTVSERVEFFHRRLN